MSGVEGAEEPMPTDREEERERFRELRRTEDHAQRDAIIADHLWLARHGARRFTGRGESHDDLLQVASLALVNAVDRFDPEMDVRFSTYAMPTIIGELRRHFRDRTWSMRVSRRLKDLHLELRSAKEELTHLLDRAPTVDELADFLDTTPDEVLEALEAGAVLPGGEPGRRARGARRHRDRGARRARHRGRGARRGTRARPAPAGAPDPHRPATGGSST